MWMPVEGIADAELVNHASRRGLVRMDDGRIATLCMWPSHRARVSGRYVRLRSTNDKAFTVHASRVTDWWVEPQKGTTDGS